LQNLSSYILVKIPQVNEIYNADWFKTKASTNRKIDL